VGINSFYQNAPYLNWNGYRLLAIDGSTAVLPKHKSIEDEFGVTNFGPEAASPRSIARISVLYDVLNLTALDGQISGYTTSEKTLALAHLDSVNPASDILIFDRGYPGLPLMFQLQALGIRYIIRMCEGWWKEVRTMVAAGETDKQVTFKLPPSEKALLQQYNTKEDIIKCRLVVVDLPQGGKEVLCTSILDNQTVDYKEFCGLYHLRWNIEEAIKLMKCRMHLEAFSGKTALAIKQDFYAKIFMMTTTAVLAFPVEERIKKEIKKHGSRKHPYKVNRTNALAIVREIGIGVFIKRLVSKALKAVDAILQKTTEIVRPNRRNPRKKIKKKPPSTNYKQL